MNEALTRRKAGFMLLCSVLYVATESPLCREPVGDPLQSSTCASNIFELSVEATETGGDGMGCDWSYNKNIISGITFPGLTSHPIYFVHCLLCTLRTNRTPNKI